MIHNIPLGVIVPVTYKSKILYPRHDIKYKEIKEKQGGWKQKAFLNSGIIHNFYYVCSYRHSCRLKKHRL